MRRTRRTGSFPFLGPGRRIAARRSAASGRRPFVRAVKRSGVDTPSTQRGVTRGTDRPRGFPASCPSLAGGEFPASPAQAAKRRSFTPLPPAVPIGRPTRSLAASILLDRSGILSAPGRSRHGRPGPRQRSVPHRCRPMASGRRATNVGRTHGFTLASRGKREGHLHAPRRGLRRRTRRRAGDGRGAPAALASQMGRARGRLIQFKVAAKPGSSLPASLAASCEGRVPRSVITRDPGPTALSDPADTAFLSSSEDSICSGQALAGQQGELQEAGDQQDIAGPCDRQEPGERVPRAPCVAGAAPDRHERPA